MLARQTLQGVVQLFRVAGVGRNSLFIPFHSNIVAPLSQRFKQTLLVLSTPECEKP
jgi:hypothetical protein